MSERGQTGSRKLFFGATTERVLRETAVPVLVTPSVDPGPIHVEDAKQSIGRIVVPVDLSRRHTTRRTSPRNSHGRSTYRSCSFT